jgi:hypothetical protein
MVTSYSRDAGWSRVPAGVDARNIRCKEHLARLLYVRNVLYASASQPFALRMGRLRGYTHNYHCILHGALNNYPLPYHWLLILKAIFRRWEILTFTYNDCMNRCTHPLTRRNSFRFDCRWPGYPSGPMKPETD